MVTLLYMYGEMEYKHSMLDAQSGRHRLLATSTSMMNIMSTVRDILHFMFTDYIL